LRINQNISRARSFLSSGVPVRIFEKVRIDFPVQEVTIAGNL
jgi:hypothetical protein